MVEVMWFEDISIRSSGGHFDQQSGTICAMLVESIMRNIFVKLYGIWLSG